MRDLDWLIENLLCSWRLVYRHDSAGGSLPKDCQQRDLRLIQCHSAVEKRIAARDKVPGAYKIRFVSRRRRRILKSGLAYSTFLSSRIESVRCRLRHAFWDRPRWRRIGLEPERGLDRLPLAEPAHHGVENRSQE